MENLVVQFETIEQLETVIPTLDKAEVTDVSVRNKKADEYQAIWNLSQGYLEAIKPKKYGIIQHQDAFMPVVKAIKDSNLQCHGRLYNNRGLVEIEILFENAKLMDNKNLIEFGIRAVNNYAKPDFSVDSFGFRVVCTNGMILKKIMGGFKVDHRMLEELDKKTADFISKLFEKIKRVDNLMVVAKEEVIDEDEAKEIVYGEIGGKERTLKILEIITENNGENRWDLYNSITQYATHYAKSRSQREWMQRVAQRVLVNPASKLRRRIMPEEE